MISFLRQVLKEDLYKVSYMVFYKFYLCTVQMQEMLNFYIEIYIEICKENSSFFPLN